VKAVVGSLVPIEAEVAVEKKAAEEKSEEAAVGDDADADADAASHSATTTAVLQRYKSIKYTSNDVADENGVSFNSKLDAVTNYLAEIYHAADTNADGYLPHYKFWSIFADNKFVRMCYNQFEIDSMPALTFQDYLVNNEGQNGQIYYEECLPEIADGLISHLESEQKDVLKLIEDEVASASHEELESLYQSVKETNQIEEVVPICLPPDLETLLQNTFISFDKDKSGNLSRDEFWNLIKMLNLNIATTGGELDELVKSFDTNGDDKIEWAEACPKFHELLHDLASDLRDHWIGLEDISQSPPLCFWYNLLDGSSQWMTAEEQAEYVLKDEDADAKASKGPAIKAKFISKVGLISNMNRLKKEMEARADRKVELENDATMDAEKKAALLAQIETDNADALAQLKHHQESAKKVLDQRLDADKVVKAKKLRARLDKKKRRQVV